MLRLFGRAPAADPALPTFGSPPRPLTVVRNARARSMKLSVDPRDGVVRLVLPTRAALGHALGWVETKRGWIEGQLGKVKDAVPIVAGTTIPWRGAELRVDWSADHPRMPRLADDRLLVGGPADTLELRVLRWIRAEAKRLLEEETRLVALRAGVTVATVSVGDPRSRWGSCASNGNIRYSWRLLLAPDFVWKATVAHEVAHRVHMDHSRAFHALVASLFGADPKPAREWLRRHGAALHGLGRS